MAVLDHILGRGRWKVPAVVVVLVGDVDVEVLVLLSSSSGQDEGAEAIMLTRERNSGRVAPSRR